MPSFLRRKQQAAVSLKLIRCDCGQRILVLDNASVYHGHASMGRRCYQKVNGKVREEWCSMRVRLIVVRYEPVDNAPLALTDAAGRQRKKVPVQKWRSSWTSARKFIGKSLDYKAYTSATCQWLSVQIISWGNIWQDAVCAESDLRETNLVVAAAMMGWSGLQKAAIRGPD